MGRVGLGGLRLHFKVCIPRVKDVKARSVVSFIFILVYMLVSYVLGNSRFSRFLLVLFVACRVVTPSVSG